MSVIPAEAQAIFKEQIPVKIRSLRQVDDSVLVDLEFDFSQLSFPSNRSLVLTPVLVNDAGKQARLKALVLNGRRYHKAYLREAGLTGRRIKPSQHAVIAFTQAAKRVYRYRQSVAFEHWMREARMEVITDLCGCGVAGQQLASEKIANRIIMEGAQAYRVLPNVAYLRPEVETEKLRSESHNIFLDFPVARMEINPYFGNNPQELAKVEAIIDRIRHDRNVQVTGVVITGYASPEGNAAFNNRLSWGRAEALAAYLSNRAYIPPRMFRVDYGGEDWDGLAQLVRSSYIQPKETILSIIRYYSPEERKRHLKALGGGQVYRRMLHELYPPLRKVVSRIEYTVRGFNVEEAKQVIEAHPRQLSLNEMFLVANTYPEGSKEFESVFETMVEVFPDDPVANLNAAACALLKKDLAKAERYLRKAKKNTPAYYNNLGVLSMMRNNPARAKRLFQLAAEANLDVALKNLEEIKKKETADFLLTN
jgi:outer membrane protein OmpA-like peptidoglycan-associated protein